MKAVEVSQANPMVADLWLFIRWANLTLRMYIVQFII